MFRLKRKKRHHRLHRHNNNIIYTFTAAAAPPDSRLRGGTSVRLSPSSLTAHCTIAQTRHYTSGSTANTRTVRQHGSFATHVRRRPSVRKQDILYIFFEIYFPPPKRACARTSYLIARIKFIRKFPVAQPTLYTGVGDFCWKNNIFLVFGHTLRQRGCYIIYVYVRTR